MKVRRFFVGFGETLGVLFMSAGVFGTALTQQQVDDMGANFLAEDLRLAALPVTGYRSAHIMPRLEWAAAPDVSFSHLLGLMSVSPLLRESLFESILTTAVSPLDALASEPRKNLVNALKLALWRSLQEELTGPITLSQLSANLPTAQLPTSVNLTTNALKLQAIEEDFVPLLKRALSAKMVDLPTVPATCADLGSFIRDLVDDDKTKETKRAVPVFKSPATAPLFAAFGMDDAVNPIVRVPTELRRRSLQLRPLLRLTMAAPNTAGMKLPLTLQLLDAEYHLMSVNDGAYMRGFDGRFYLVSPATCKYVHMDTLKTVPVTSAVYARDVAALVDDSAAYVAVDPKAERVWTLRNAAFAVAAAFFLAAFVSGASLIVYGKSRQQK